MIENADRSSGKPALKLRRKPGPCETIVRVIKQKTDIGVRTLYGYEPLQSVWEFFYEGSVLLDSSASKTLSSKP